LTPQTVNAMGTAMGRTLPKIIVLAGIGLVVIAIYVTVQRLSSRPAPGVIYIDPGIGAQNP
jgi:hypothetical protein